jgi:predicted transcriptional regulator
LQRRLRVAELAAQGRTQLEIALELGVSQPTICADLNEIHAQWRQAAEAETADRIAREIAMIEEIRRAAWQGWARSQQDAERKRVKRTAAPDQDSGVKVERTKERRTQSGDSKMLQTALKCSEMILRTLGAFKTKATPPVNTWDTVLKALYQSQATGNGQSDAGEEPGARGQGPGAREKPAGAEPEAEDLDIPPKPSDADLEPGEYWEPVEVEVDDGEEEPGARGQGPEEPGTRGQGPEEPGARGQGPGAREENAETPTPAAPVSGAEPAAEGCCSSGQAGGRPHGREAPTPVASESDAEPGAVGADEPDDWWARRWSRLANEWSGGLANAPPR